MELWFSTYSSYRKNDHFFLRIITIAELRVDSRQVVESLTPTTTQDAVGRTHGRRWRLQHAAATRNRVGEASMAAALLTRQCRHRGDVFAATRRACACSNRATLH